MFVLLQKCSKFKKCSCFQILFINSKIVCIYQKMFGIFKKYFVLTKLFRMFLFKILTTFKKYSRFENMFPFQKLFAIFKKWSFLKFCLVRFSLEKLIFKKLFIILKKMFPFSKNITNWKMCLFSEFVHKLKNAPLFEKCSQIQKMISFCQNMFMIVKFCSEFNKMFIFFQDLFTNLKYVSVFSFFQQFKILFTFSKKLVHFYQN